MICDQARGDQAGREMRMQCLGVPAEPLAGSQLPVARGVIEEPARGRGIYLRALTELRRIIDRHDLVERSNAELAWRDLPRCQPSSEFRSRDLVRADSRPRDDLVREPEGDAGAQVLIR